MSKNPTDSLILALGGKMGWHEAHAIATQAIRSGADVNALDTSGTCALVLAAQRFGVELTLQLLRAGAYPDGCYDRSVMARDIPLFAAVVGQKHLPPNVDWPSARLYHYMGLDIEIYTPIFAMARVAGWSAHIIEQLDNNRLMRPRARYIGPPNRTVKPLDQR